MTPVFKASAVLLLTLVPLTAASAQGSGGGSMGSGSGMMQQGGSGMMGPGRFLPDPASLPALKEKLLITAQQEPQWTAYAGTVSKAWGTRQTMHQSMQTQPMAPADRQETRAAHREAGTEIHAEMQKARDALAAVLTPEQRKILDQQAPPMPAGMGPPR